MNASEDDGAFRWIIAAAWAVTVVPNFFQKIFAVNQQVLLNETRPTLPAISLVRDLFTVLLVGTCVLAIHRAQRRGVPRRLSALLVFVLPFSVLAAEAVVRGEALSAAAFTYPFLVFTTWMCRPRLSTLSTLGFCGAVTAGVSLLMGVLQPQQGLYANFAGRLAVTDKGLLFDSLLSGVFGSANNLGQFLALSFPCAVLIKSRRWRTSCLLIIAVAVVWTNSRSAIAVVVATLGIVLIGTRISSAGARMLMTAAVYLSLVVSLVLPVLTYGSSRVFSGRGLIWTLSIDAWMKAPYFGLGSGWYAQAAQSTIGFGESAVNFLFHGHNQFLHVLVTGGAVCLSLVVVMTIYCGVEAVRLLRNGVYAGCAVVVAFCVSGALELNLGYLDRQQFLVTALLPLAVVAMTRDSRRNKDQREVERLSSSSAGPRRPGSDGRQNLV